MAQTLAELTSVDDPAGPLLREWLEAGQVDAQILAVEPERCDQCLVGMQVTLRSVLGALAYETGGLLIDHGWLRLLGGGHGTLPSLYEALGLNEGSTAPEYFVLGWDVVGGEAREGRRASCSSRGGCSGDGVPGAFRPGLTA